MIDRFYLVRYFDEDTKTDDLIVYKSSSVSRLFDEIIDFLGPNADIYSIEHIYVTDLDIKEID